MYTSKITGSLLASRGDIIAAAPRARVRALHRAALTVAEFHFQLLYPTVHIDDDRFLYSDRTVSLKNKIALSLIIDRKMSTVASLQNLIYQ